MRIRTIKPEFFTHEGIYEAELATGLPLRLAFVGLWCAADREGRFKWEPRRLGVSILPYDSTDFSRVLDALTTRGFVIKYRVGDAFFGCIPSFTRHQVINNREAPSAIPDPSTGEPLTITETRDADACPTRAPREKGEGKGREGERKEGNSSCPESATPDELPLDPHKNPEAEAAVDWFLALLAETGAKPLKLTPSARNGWVDAFDKLIRLDGHTMDRVKAVCRWARNDPFWRDNFMAPPKLRDKKHGVSYMDQFANKMGQAPAGSPVRVGF